MRHYAACEPAECLIHEKRDGGHRGGRRSHRLFLTADEPGRGRSGRCADSKKGDGNDAGICGRILFFNPF